MRFIRHALIIPLLLAAAPSHAQAACPVTGTQPMLIVTLYFGETIPGRAPLTPSEWTDFATHSLTPAFPGGFTVSNGSGQWRDPQNGAVEYDPTKIVTAALPDSQTVPASILDVMKAYEHAYHQDAVGLTTSEACGSFNQ
jgi:hypothetical protein